MISAVLFDLDDTLYDRGGAFARWLDDYLHHECGIADDTARQQAVRRIALLDAGGYGSKAAVLEDVCRLYPPIDASQNGSRESSTFYEQFFSQLTLDSDANALLAALDRVGTAWGVITNGKARQWRKLEQMGLIGRTPCLFVSETFGCPKPDPAIFLAAASCLGVSSADTLFVGDHPTNDIVGAQRVGMQTAWLTRGKPWPAEHQGITPDYTIHRLAELIPLLG